MKNMLKMSLLSVATCGIAFSAVAASLENFFCSGYEPGWSVTTKGAKGSIEAADIVPTQSFAFTKLNGIASNLTVLTFNLQKSAKGTLVIKEEACSDAGEVQYTHYAVLVMGNQYFDGCCRLTK